MPIALKSKASPKAKFKANSTAKSSQKKSTETVATSPENACKTKQGTHAGKTTVEATKPSTAKTSCTKASKEASVPTGEISEETLKEAESLGLVAGLRNLASRPEVINLNLPSSELLRVLRASEGLVNKAKAVLLDAGCASSPPTGTSHHGLPVTDATCSKKVEMQPESYKQQCDQLRSLLSSA